MVHDSFRDSFRQLCWSRRLSWPCRRLLWSGSSWWTSRAWPSWRRSRALEVCRSVVFLFLFLTTFSLSTSTAFYCLIFLFIVDRSSTIKEQIIVGTPGTVLDWLTKTRVLDPRKVLIFVLDEADVMISQQGHQDQSVRIYKCVLVSRTWNVSILPGPTIAVCVVWSTNGFFSNFVFGFWFLVFSQDDGHEGCPDGLVLRDLRRESAGICWQNHRESRGGHGEDGRAESGHHLPVLCDDGERWGKDSGAAQLLWRYHGGQCDRLLPGKGPSTNDVSQGAGGGGEKMLTP